MPLFRRTSSHPETKGHQSAWEPSCRKTPAARTLAGLVLFAAFAFACQSTLADRLSGPRKPLTTSDATDSGTAPDPTKEDIPDSNPGSDATALPTTQDAGGASDPRCSLDSDEDGVDDCADDCPTDSLKTEAGACGCGTSDKDTDLDGVADCHDECRLDSNKTEMGVCGCGKADTDSDGDGTPNCQDKCPADPLKTAAGICGCHTKDIDLDADGKVDCEDTCPKDDSKLAPGACGCGVPDTDSDDDGTADCNDECDSDPAKTKAGLCGCGSSDADGDFDGTPNCDDKCPEDPNKAAPGGCGCGKPDADTDSDKVLDCNDECPDDPAKIAPGLCGCGAPDTATVAECNDECPNDPSKSTPGTCGCGVPDTDGDSDGVKDCEDLCPTSAGASSCGCKSEVSCFIAEHKLGKNLSLESVVSQGDADSSSKYTGTSNGSVRDDDFSTAWAPSSVPDGSAAKEENVSIKWLGAAQKYDTVILVEVGNAVQKFRLERLNGQVLATGTTIGSAQLLQFSAVTDERMRLVIEKANQRPKIGEILIYDAP